MREKEWEKGKGEYGRENTEEIINKTKIRKNKQERKIKIE